MFTRFRHIAFIAFFFAVFPASIMAQDCRSDHDEFKDVTTLECGYAEIDIEEQPRELIYEAQVKTVRSEGTDPVFMGIKSESESWNFHNIDTAYLLIDGERAEFDAERLDGETLDGGDVMETLIISVPNEHLRQLSTASSIRMKIGSAVFEMGNVLPGFIEEIQQM